MIGNIIGWCVFGLIAGGIARFLTPGRHPMGCIATIGLGVAGSFVFGLIAHLLFGRGGDDFEPAGMVGAVLGGILVLWLMRRFVSRKSDAERE